MVKKALLIGINYKDTDNELYGCINDITNINNFLVNNCLYNSSNIKVLTDDSDTKPTFLNIKEQINWLISNTVSGDTLIFYYSGHGSYIRDRNGDESDARDEIIVPLNYDTGGFITDDWLFTNMISKIPANVTLWCFTDCCHSGTIADLKYNYRSNSSLKKGKTVINNSYVSSDWTDKFSLSLEKSTNILGKVYLFSGCRDTETSADAYINKTSQGAFTFCLLEFLKKNICNTSKRFLNGTVKLRNVLKEINCRLDINGFTEQNSQLSLCKQEDFEKTIDF
jgi:hypothetical protein